MKGFHKIHRLVFKTGACIGVLLLAACGPGGGSGGGGGDPIIAAWSAGFTGTEDAALATSIANTAEFRSANFNSAGRVAVDPHPFLLTKVHRALSTGVSGEGQVVAVVDDGFLTTHEEFSGKIIHEYGVVTPHLGSNHGTHVASIATGNYGTGDIMGVAPNADLHLSSFARNNMGGLAAATNDAAAKGAVVQNNSWGFDVVIGDAQAQMSGGKTAAEAMAAEVGDSSANWQSYINALNNFQNGGVIVFASSNNNLGDVDVSAGLPLLATELQEAWISVVEAKFSVDSDHNIISASLISTPCGQAAQFCLVGDGDTKGASDNANNAYETGWGTSYTAPQIAGGVALVAQAFPSLSPGEWRDRLLATANNNFFAGSESGSTNFGGGITHAYSNIFGHGVMDVAAALQPIGDAVVVRGSNLETGTRTRLGDATISTSGTYGDGLTRMLQEQEMAVFDALNGNFEIRADYFVAENQNRYRSASLDQLQDKGQAKTSLSFGESSDSVESVLYFGAQDGLAQLQTDLGLSSNLASNVSMLSFAETATAISQNYKTEFGHYGFYGFSGQHSENVNGSLSGAGALAQFDLGNSSLRVGLNQMVESGAFLGMVGNEAFNTPTLTSAQSVNLSFNSSLSNGFEVFGGAEMGRAVGQTNGDGFVTNFDDANFSGFHVGVAKSNLVQKGDRVTLSLAQPIRADSGNVTMNLPVGRDKDGNIIYDQVTGDLSPSGREIDFAASYFMELDAFSDLQFDVMYALDAGHIAGQRSYGIGASFKRDLN
ncbi:S8 family serine peptidase [Maritalea mediterranea]|uniref:S8 family serine peptidase n=1 Tax=Maritalea mediterranea TaxID=2909667 RepID=A0ABS9E663_9HYPH|nr:S8 family peptidase [Maritalea mediterranea]MCF4097702.1 S8 family serine peptidase [Maritalea mediterranea]